MARVLSSWKVGVEGRTGLLRTPGLALCLLMLVLFSCTSVGLERAPVVPSAFIELNPSERAHEQRRSLTHVFYDHNDLPPKPSAQELRRVKRDLERAPRIEVEELRGLFGDDLELLAYATRDTDGDGVLDFRVSEYRGKFFEGDIDVDGDGVRNVYDAAPYNKRVGGEDLDGDGIPDDPGSFADRDGDGIPDHLDWTRPKGEAIATLQTELFRDFGVILVERSARYTPELVHAVDDTMRLVFREPLPTLRTIAVEDQLLISPDMGDNGFMLGQTQTLTLCVDSIAEADPLVMLGLVVHEVGHAWQLAHDFDHHDLHHENKKIHFEPGSFADMLEDFGWAVDEHSASEGYYHRLYWPHFYATSPRYLYNGHAPNEWAAWFEDIQAQYGADFLVTSDAHEWGMVGPYSMTSPWEWHADNLMASVYNRMDQGILAHPNHTYRRAAPLLSQRMVHTIQRQWSRFDYRNASGTEIDRALAEDFELSEDELQHLVDRYVVPLVDLPMLAQVFTLEPAPEPGTVLGVPREELDALSEELVAAWTKVRSQVDEPLSRMPSLERVRFAGLERPRSGEARPKPRNPSEAEPALDELALTDETRAEAETMTETETGEPSRPPLREVLEQAKQPSLGDRHSAGRVGGVVAQPLPTSAELALAETPDLAVAELIPEGAELPLPEATERSPRPL